MTRPFALFNGLTLKAAAFSVSAELNRWRSTRRSQIFLSHLAANVTKTMFNCSER